MPLLCNTHIDLAANECIIGQIGRIGGTVNQLLDYKNCTVTEINVKNDRKTRYGSSVIGKFRYGYDILEQEIRYYRKGWRAVRDRKTIWMDIHNAPHYTEFHNRFDATISSNVAEHSFNTILFFLNTWLITRLFGWQYHAIPCCRFTFDKFRTITPLSHFINDFENSLTVEQPEDADRHFADFEQSAKKSGRTAHDYERRIPYLHYHVFDEHNTKELLSFMFEDVTTDVLRDSKKFSDVVVLFKNTLRNEFIQKYSKLAQEAYGIILR
jgi:hypothetical protein